MAKEELPDQNETECKVCREIKLRIRSGNYNDRTKTKRWLDENGGLWMGRTCPDCNRVRCKNNMRVMRSK